MLTYALSTLSIVTFGLSAITESKLPIITCKRDSVDYSTCFKNFLQEAWPQIFKGLPEYDFPSLDPLLYKYGKIVLNSDMMHGEIIMSNFAGIGLSNLRFTDVRTHFLDDVFRLEIDTQVPSLYVEGTIKVNATVGAFRTTGEGQLNVTVEDVRTLWVLTGHVVNDTWIVEHFNNSPSIGKFKLYMDLFENKEFNDIIVAFINEFWPALYRGIIPFFVNTWDSWLIEFPNKIFSKVPFSKLFP